MLASLNQDAALHAVDSCNAELSALRRRLIVLILLSVLSAVTFVFVVHQPVFDETNFMPDVLRYATRGITVETVRQHLNAPGPTSFIWMAESFRVLGGNALNDARIASLVSWILLSSAVLFGAMISRTPALWYYCLLATLTFPHSMTTSAMALTEGPALLFAVLGTLLWVESVITLEMTSSAIILCITGGILIGLSVTARQYFIALLPAMVLFLIYYVWFHKPKQVLARVFAVSASLTLAVIPIAVLASVWGGISSPAMTVYYRGVLDTGPNFERAGIAAFYAALYLVPLTFPAIRLLTRNQSIAMATIALTCGILVLPFQSIIVQPGPLGTFLSVTRSFLGQGEPIVFFLLTTALIFNLLALIRVLWRCRLTILDKPIAVFAVLVILIFVTEQILVQGNPFYDRYILQIAPFLGVVGFSLLRRASYARLSGCAALYLIGQAMLWRYAA